MTDISPSATLFIRPDIGRIFPDVKLGVSVPRINFHLSPLTPVMKLSWGLGNSTTTCESKNRIKYYLFVTLDQAWDKKVSKQIGNFAINLMINSNPHLIFIMNIILLSESRLSSRLFSTRCPNKSRKVCLTTEQNAFVQ